MKNKILELKNVSKEYKLGKIIIKALDNISFSLEEGEFISIVGPSGSGKTTLLNLIGGLDKPTSGTILLNGIDLCKMSERQLTKIRREKIGFVFQFYNLIPVLTAIENIDLPMMAASRKKKERKQRALELLKIVGLEERRNHRPEEMSGGERQRVAIARALANSPSMILADEPTGDLDTTTGEEIIKFLKNLHVTTLIVTHDPLVAKTTNKIIYLKDGKIERIEKIEN
ncbi:MAG: ABC transporter ATP-binding protein [Candidatus Helarchaeota archaeon]